ncbi:MULTISPECIES: diacylglycerol kinase family protein [unclassified Streptomyces]|uniref:diacylglycerol/lipid kinase family protein n=1 Tax=unclassified Streptomyces TaxID=2593676 RepID=UPI002E16EBFF|nr:MULTISPECIES: diacylglycerol kinase family protein [unclassified Streptomyces]
MEPTTHRRTKHRRTTQQRGQRWLARGSLAAAAAAVLVLAVFAGLRTFALLGAGILGTAVTAAAVWWVLSRRGPARYLALLLALAAPVWVLVEYTRAHLLWVVLVSGGLWLLAAGAGRAALGPRSSPAPMPETPAPAFHRPVLIMNPRSGGGKVDRFGLRAKAEQLGADVVLLEGPEPVDVAALARARAAAGADLLGVAGGDGTQALVADVAAELGLPFLVIPAGTRNHFALDLGLDREDPSKALDALSDGVELRVDLGRAGGLPFVNNVSFGAYAEVVQSPAYRDGKTRTTLDLLPDLLARHQGAELTARVDEHEVTDPQALLVSNNPYGARDIAGLGRRTRLDGGILGCVGVRVTSAAQAAGLLRGSRSAGVTTWSAASVVVDADQDSIPVGLDGEAVRMDVPVRIEVRPGALRVIVPRQRPGTYRERPPLDWRGITGLALTVRRP